MRTARFGDHWQIPILVGKEGRSLSEQVWTGLQWWPLTFSSRGWVSGYGRYVGGGGGVYSHVPIHHGKWSHGNPGTEWQTPVKTSPRSTNNLDVDVKSLVNDIFSLNFFQGQFDSNPIFWLQIKVTRRTKLWLESRHPVITLSQRDNGRLLVSKSTHAPVWKTKSNNSFRN